MKNVRKKEAAAHSGISPDGMPRSTLTPRFLSVKRDKIVDLGLASLGPAALFSELLTGLQRGTPCCE